MSSGVKLDQGKADWSLLPMAEVGEVVSVLTMGASKYARDNWKLVPRAQDRYFAAAMRHLAAWRGGERCDPESGLNHLAHAACNLLFLLWFDNKEQQP